MAHGEHCEQQQCTETLLDSKDRNYTKEVKRKKTERFYEFQCGRIALD